MSRVVIRMQSDPNPDPSKRKTRFYLESSPGFNPSGAGTPRLLTLPTTPDPFSSMRSGELEPNVVREAGFLLFRKLAAHPAVKQAISLALTHNALHPIYIFLESEKAAELPWESLCNPATGEFLSLDRSWPVGRIVNSPAYAVERAVEPPVRMTLVLAAAGSKPCYGSSCYEWVALSNAVGAARFKVALQIFVCDDDLKQFIINSSLSPNVTIQEVNSVPRQQDRQDLFKAINGFGPNILHFYCHGSSDPANPPHLELASRDDYDQDMRDGSIDIYARELWDATGRDLEPHIWLVTLNCCQGAALGPADAHSLASELVEKGFPAAIGMREAVASIDAHAFCEAFYCSLLDEIQRCLHYGRLGINVEWSHLMHEPRMRLRDRHLNGRPPTQAESESKEWTLPAIYIRRRDFKLRGCSTNDQLTAIQKQEDQVQLDKLKEKLEEEKEKYDSYTTSPSVFQSIDIKIRTLENRLYP